MRLLRKRGTLILATRKGAPALGFNFDHLAGQQVTLKGVRGHSFHSVELALRAMASGRYPLEIMSTQVVGLADVDMALRAVGGETSRDVIHLTVAPWKNEDQPLAVV
ncbi:MAG: hypothetical protein WDN76_11835 [Alphaproteobacteria bacterium]